MPQILGCRELVPLADAGAPVNCPSVLRAESSSDLLVLPACFRDVVLVPTQGAKVAANAQQG